VENVYFGVPQFEKHEMRIRKQNVICADEEVVEEDDQTQASYKRN
jgi:hypothetical protein